MHSRSAHAHKQTGVNSNLDQHTDAIMQMNVESTQRKLATKICRHEPSQRRMRTGTQAYTNHKSWLLKLLNIPPRAVNLHSQTISPTVCVSTVLEHIIKPNQGHLQDCFDQQFLPNSEITSPVTACLTFTCTLG